MLEPATRSGVWSRKLPQRHNGPLPFAGPIREREGSFSFRRRFWIYFPLAGKAVPVRAAAARVWWAAVARSSARRTAPGPARGTQLAGASRYGGTL